MPLSCNLYALHGFLGLPSDWDVFDKITYKPELNNETLSLWGWADQFNESIPFSNKKNLLLGYSLGGRLAMHALIANPAIWDGAIFVSANPGLDSIEERNLRFNTDRQWSQKILENPWENLLQDWNKQEVFQNRPVPFTRSESQFDRDRLSKQIVNWSVGSQESLIEKMQNLEIPILYVAGECDAKFKVLAEQFKSFAEVSIVPDAAHRVPWDQPQKFSELINHFVIRYANSKN
jgi:2-succinyl-6-hydroxy-2,4-cyclohexadiene-1-carboxylate synthase